MKIDRTIQVTWPVLVERARAYLAENTPDNPGEWARHFAAGILAMEKEMQLRRAFGEPATTPTPGSGVDG